MSSSSINVPQFNGYRFGEPIDTANATSSSQHNSQQSVSLEMYDNRGPSSSSNIPVSPLQRINSQQPLTRDMLEKKDILDLLLSNMPTSSSSSSSVIPPRRRSICNGNIYRHLYNEDNSPIILATPFRRISSKDSNASINSSNSRYDLWFNRHFSSRRHVKHTHSKRDPHKHSASHAPPPLSNDSSRDRSYDYGSMRNRKSSTNSQSMNTSHASSGGGGRRRPFTYYHMPPQQLIISSDRPRRFSVLVRLSIAHIALHRARKNNKRRRQQSTVDTILHTLEGMASRVVNSRISEPADTKISIEELTSLSRYLYVLKNGCNKDDSSHSEDGNNTRTTPSDGAQIPIIPNHPMFGSFLDDATGNEHEHEHEHELSPLLTSPPKRNKKQNLGILGNIFPFAPIDRRPSISSLGSPESSRINTTTESSRLLSPLSPRFRTSPRSLHTATILIKMSKFIKHVCRSIVHFQQYQRHKELNTQIRFEGWSLFFFSPTSSTRFHLWKIVGSRWFEGLILLLLLIQWMLMSFVPVSSLNKDPALFTSLGDHLLLLIYIIYTFELISKTIVYGLILNRHSHSAPNLQSWFSRIRNNTKRRRLCFFSSNDVESIILQDEEEEEEEEEEDADDAASLYVRSQHRHSLLPTYANTARSMSSAAAALSIPPNTERTYGNHAAHRHLSEPPSSASLASPGAMADDANTSWPLDGLESAYNSIPHLPLPRRRTQIKEDATSILSAAEQQVLASLNPCPHRTSAAEESDVDFLKVTHKSLLSNFSNSIDLISVTSYWIDLIIVFHLGKRPYPIFQALAATRLLRLLVITEGTTVIMKSLRSSYDMLKNVMGFFVFFWLLFSLAALSIFMNAFTRRCAVWPQEGLHKNLTDILYVEPRVSCSGYMTSANERTGPYDINTGTPNTHPGVDGLFCKLGQVCIQDVANQPEYGHMSYKNILYAMLNILTVISTENWTDLLYITQDSVSSVGAAIFYSFCIYLMTFIMVPMFIAVITTSFSHIRGDMRESAFSSKRKTRLLLASGKRQKAHHRHHHHHQGEHEDEEDHEEWIYEGTGLGGHLQTRSLIQEWAHYITCHAYFPYLGSILVGMNVFSMMFYNANMPTQDKIYYDLVGRVYTSIFALEIMVRMYGCMHWKQFWQRSRNRVDLIIVIATVVDSIPFVQESKYHIFLLVFSVCRSYRIAYLFPGVLRLLSEVIGDGQGIMNLTFFTFLVLLLLSPMSVQLFGGDFEFVGQEEPSMRFDNSYQAFLALFQIMTGENWTDILYDAMHSQEEASVFYAAIYMIFLYFSVHYMVLNLFIAVIVENFDLDEDEIKQIQIKKYIREHRWKPEYFKMDTISRLLLPLFVIQDEKKLDFKSIPHNLVAQVTGRRFKDFLVGQDSSDDSNSKSPQRASSSSRSRSSSSENLSHPRSTGKSPSSSTATPRGTPNGRTASIVSQFSNSSLRLDTASMTYADDDEDEDDDDDDEEPPLVKYDDEYELNVARENKAVIVENLNVFRSIVILRKDNIVRKVCTRLAAAQGYNWIIVGLIGVSTLLALWADKSNREKHPTMIRSVIEPLHALLLLIYGVDMCIHMVADGVFMLPESYMRNTWNLLDVMNLAGQAVLTVLALTDMGFSAKMATLGGCLRILRALRSMRIVYYVKGMRVIVLDLIYGLPKMIDAVALNALVFVPFAIYGSFLFSGQFFVCNDDRVWSKQECFGEFQSADDDHLGILLPRTWKNPYDYSFDTFGKSLLHLFECASGEGWIVSLFSAMSVIPGDRNRQPQFSWSSSSIFYSLYYVIFMFVASLCSIQLFIGVFLEIFKQRSGISSLTNTQRQFRDLQRQLALVKPSRKSDRPPDGSLKAMCYDLVIDKRGKFAQFMATVLTANIIVFATEHLHQPEWLGHFQDVLNAICLCLYVLEMGVKIAGLGLYKWASARWNIYDMALVWLAILTSIPKYFGDLPFGWDVSRKLCLVGIAFRLAQRNESLDTLFRSVKRALPSIFFVTSVFFIVLVCFGVAFQEEFSSTRYGPYGNEHANFRSLFNTILTLFRITTGEDWDFLMHDFTVLPPGCVGNDDCGFPNYAILLFISFYVVCTYIFVNLFTVIVIDNFSFTFDKRNQFTLITRTDLRHFKKAWAMLDPRATGFIGVSDVSKFLSMLEGVLSIRIYEKEHSLIALLEASNRSDGNVEHLIAVPLSDATGTNNTMGERSFNLYEFNKRLADIDPEVINQRKRQYAEVYQEITNASSRRGIAFHRMLEILALRLVDVSKSLTFDGLVNRARIQDKIDKQLATERAKGLVNMMIERRNYLKKRQKAKHIQSISVGNWLRPGSSRLSSPNLERSNPFLQLRPSISESTQSQQGPHTTGVPRIVVDKARQQRLDSNTVSDTILQNQQDLLRLPDRFATSVNGLVERRNGTTTRSQQTVSPASSSFSSSDEMSMTPPKTLTRRATALPMQIMSLAADILGRNPNRIDNTMTDVLALDDTEDDVFIQYYATDVTTTMDGMTSSDAKKIIHKFQHNAWSDLLQHEAYSDNNKQDR